METTSILVIDTIMKYCDYNTRLEWYARVDRKQYRELISSELMRKLEWKYSGIYMFIIKPLYILHFPQQGPVSYSFVYKRRRERHDIINEIWHTHKYFASFYGKYWCLSSDNWLFDWVNYFTFSLF